MVPDSEEIDLVGSTIGAYSVTALLGRGGMGVVYRAEQAPLGRPVALKVIHDHLALDARTVARFLREAKIACSLKNPNTITIYDFGKSTEGRLYMAMELLEGQSLAARLKQATPIEPPEAIEIAVQVCRSLAEAHAKSIVHRDLKPENVFLTAADDGSLLVKVLDYGIARAGAESKVGVDKPETLTRAGTLIGTPAYMAPEQARGEAVDGRTDLWALGVILYECLTGERPFTGDNAVVVLGKLLSDPPLPMAKAGRRKRPPPELEALVDALLSKECDERPPTALVVQARLRQIGGLGGTGKMAAVAATAASDDAALAGSWELPVELATPTPSPPPSQTVATFAATPPALAAELALPRTTPVSTTPVGTAGASVRTPSPAGATPPPGTARHRGPVEIASPEDEFDHDFTPVAARLEVDRGRGRPSSGVPLAIDRPSVSQVRPRPSRPQPPPPAPRGGAGIVLVVGLLLGGAVAAWIYFRPTLPLDTVLPESVVPAAEPSAAAGPASSAPEPPVATFSQVALQREESALRADGWTETPLHSGSWAGSFTLEGGTLRLFDEGGRVTGTFEEALRSGGIQGLVRPDGVLEFSWRADGTGVVGATQGRTGSGLLRAWTRRGQHKLVGTWGYGESREGALWVASPARLGPAKRPRR